MQGHRFAYVENVRSLFFDDETVHSDDDLLVRFHGALICLRRECTD